MAGFWQGAAVDPNDPTGVSDYYVNGKNVASIIGGKLHVFDHANFNAADPGVQSVLQALNPILATPAETSKIIDEDAPGNGAGKGSMKEGLLTAAKAALAMYGAGNLIGGTGAPSITDRIQNFFTPTTTSAPMQLADAGNIMTDVGPGYGPTAGISDADMLKAVQLDEMNVPGVGNPNPVGSAAWNAFETASQGAPFLPPVPGAPGATQEPAPVEDKGKPYDPSAPGNSSNTVPVPPASGKDGSGLLDKAAGGLLSGAAAAAVSAGIGSALSKGGSSGDGGLSAASDAQKAEEDRKAGLRKRINQIYGIDDGTDDPVAKAARDSMAAEENTLGGATRNFYDEQLQHDTEKAFRNNRFALADRGTLGGSAQIDTEKELSRDNTLGATRVADQVANAIAGLKSSREQERLNATNLVNTGSGEDAVNSAQAGLTRSLSNAQAQQHASITGDLFAGGADSVASANAGYNPLLLAQYQNRLGSFFNPGSGSTARTTAT